MTKDAKSVTFVLNGRETTTSVEPKQTLLDFLRNISLFSVKSGCREGDCGMCTVLLDGNPIRSCLMEASKVDGREVTTLEGLSKGGQLHPLQQAFIETDAAQCGFCTPAQILTAKALLDRNPNPTDGEIRSALSGVLCRCTGYVQIIEGVQRAAARMRGEEPGDIGPIELELPDDLSSLELPESFYRKELGKDALLPLVYTPKEMPKTQVVGKSEFKVDGPKLVKGKPAFTDDIKLEGMLFGALLTSPHAHARIRNIDTSKAEALKGVHCVLTYKNVDRIKFASGGQSYPQPLPYDQVVFDTKVRHVGDRVAAVAAETRELAQKALRLIDVEYEILPAVIDGVKAMQDGAPVIHDEEDTEGIFDAEHNIVHHLEADAGDVDEAFKDCELIFEGDYKTPKQHHGQMEPHITITYWDEDDRLVIRTATQVPFHVRRIVAPLIGLPVKRIRVIKPRIGGGFGGKQEIITEDLCSLMTIQTGHPVRLEFTRKQEFTSGRTRHIQNIHYKAGLKGDVLEALDLYVVGDTGAYGSHGLTVQMVGGFKGLTLYNPPNARFRCDVVYTNTAPAGAYRGYGSMQCMFGVEVLMEEIAEKLGIDVVKFKQKNWIKVGEPMHLAKQMGEGREGYDQVMHTSGHKACVAAGVEATDYDAKRSTYQNQSGRYRKGIGMSIAFHGSGIAGLDMAACTLKMNDDGSFNMTLGATDLGTGSDTILGQIAAEVLGIPLNDLIIYSSDTDFTPFDKGAYASSTTYISGGAARKAAMKIKTQIQEHAAKMLDVDDPASLELKDRKVFALNGEFVTLAEVALSSLHQMDQHQIMATASHMSLESPPPTAATFVETTVDVETGAIKVDRMLMCVDCGRVINPRTAAGQVAGGMAQALGFAHSEDTYHDAEGHVLNAKFHAYHMYKADEMPQTDVIFVQTDEPSGPFGAKSISELSIDGVAPALVNAVHNATGVWMHELPLTPERVWRALKDG
ncbi:MAG: molybdopterin-dependent oxidoreductase [Anaerolineaceae bacterium]|nr:molybdopterin-dependent oxidoreductase [Anaerolineaceae bacterium]